MSSEVISSSADVVSLTLATLDGVLTGSLTVVVEVLSVLFGVTSFFPKNDCNVPCVRRRRFALLGGSSMFLVVSCISCLFLSGHLTQWPFSKMRNMD